MQLLTSWSAKALGIFALGLALFLAHLWYKTSIEKAVETRLVGEYNAKLVVEQAKAAKATQDLNDLIATHAKEREQNATKLQEAVTANSITTKRLREQVASYEQQLSRDSALAYLTYTKTLGDVFGECTEALTEMGAKAQGHADDALMLRNAWPRGE